MTLGYSSKFIDGMVVQAKEGSLVAVQRDIAIRAVGGPRDPFGKQSSDGAKLLDKLGRLKGRRQLV